MNWRHTDWHYADACEAFAPGRRSRDLYCSTAVKNYGPIPIKPGSMVERLVAPLGICFKALEDVPKRTRAAVEDYWEHYYDG